MAKKRQGSRPSAVDPSPPSIPEVGYASEKPRLCFWCGVTPAVHLADVPGIPGPPVFCSLICAAAVGLDLFSQDGIVWCHRCGRWSLPGGRCPECIEKAIQRQADARSSAAKLAAKESEVTHG